MPKTGWPDVRRLIWALGVLVLTSCLKPCPELSPGRCRHPVICSVGCPVLLLFLNVGLGQWAQTPRGVALQCDQESELFYV